MTLVLDEGQKALSFLIGRWETIEAKMQYPDKTDFYYGEILIFKPGATNILLMKAMARNLDTKNKMHIEVGMMRCDPETHVVCYNAVHNFGATTIEVGTLKNYVVEMQTTNITKSPFFSKPEIIKYKRSYWVDEGLLYYEQYMQTIDIPFSLHLTAKYHKVEEEE